MRSKIKNQGLKIAASMFGKKPNSKPLPDTRTDNRAEPHKPLSGESRYLDRNDLVQKNQSLEMEASE